MNRGDWQGPLKDDLPFLVRKKKSRDFFSHGHQEKKIQFVPEMEQISGCGGSSICLMTSTLDAGSDRGPERRLAGLLFLLVPSGGR